MVIALILSGIFYASSYRNFRELAKAKGELKDTSDSLHAAEEARNAAEAQVRELQEAKAAADEDKQIIANLAVLSFVADGYYAEHNVTTVNYDQLVGPNGPIARLDPIAGEEYSTVVLKQGEKLSVLTKSGRQVDYPP